MGVCIGLAALLVAQSADDLLPRGKSGKSRKGRRG